MGLLGSNVMTMIKIKESHLFWIQVNEKLIEHYLSINIFHYVDLDYSFRPRTILYRIIFTS